ncbi:MAG TPA: SDR family NAD(P)-dependent oxidoreductase [Acidimicrobiia bacterium]
MSRATPRFPLTGAIAVVTGASSGLGRRMAIELSRYGAVVTAIARRRERLVGVADELQRHTPDSGLAVCDVSDTDGFAAALHEIENRHGRIDVLVNNAGIGEPGGAGLRPYREVMETNFFAPVAGTLAVLPGMRARRHGAVVNVSSDSGRAPTPGETAYSASKAALSVFTEALSFEVDGDGVHLHVLYPGWVPTEMTRREGGPGRLPPKAVRRTDDQIAQLLIAGLGGRRLELDATRVARLAPMARALFPRAYRRGLRAAMR